MQRISALTRYFFLTITLATFSLALQAQENRIANPGFDSSLVGWSEFNGREANWVSFDFNQDPNSGSAQVLNQGTSDGVVPLVLFQCIVVQGLQEINFGADVTIGAGQVAGVAAYVFIEPFLNSDCSGTADSFHSAFSTVPEGLQAISSSINTGANVQSVRLSLGTFKPDGETEDAFTFFDNVFLSAPGSTDVNPSHSASWFNPDESGHGIMIHLIDESTAWMCWFAFNDAGEPVWICGLGTISGDTITFDEAFTLTGGAFPPNFDPDQIVQETWGTIVVVFTGCNEGSMTWTTSAAGFSSGSMPLTRLTSLWGVTCVDS